MADIRVLYDNDVYIDPIMTSVTWSGDVTLGFRRLEVSLMNTLDGRTRALSFEKGRELRLYDGETELFRGVIFADSIDSTGRMTLTAYDENVYLTKNRDSKRFTNMTASAIVREICADFGIPAGDIEETDYVIPKLILRDRTLWDMIITALTETKRATGKRYFVYAKEGRLCVTRWRPDAEQWLLESGTNILSATNTGSIEDLRNQVKVQSSETETKSPLVATVLNGDLIVKYGLMQHLETVDSDSSQSQIEEIARQLLEDLARISDEASIEALGNVNVVAGTAVYVVEPLSGIMGGYYVVTDEHTWTNGVHRMRVTLSANEALPTLKYSEVE